MTVRTVASLFLLGFAAFTASKDDPEKASLRIANPKELSVEMAKALVSGDRKRFTALAATREEMVTLLETALHPASLKERQEQKDKVEEILADRGEDFDRFQAMKKGRRPGKRRRPVRTDRHGPDPREGRHEKSPSPGFGCCRPQRTGKITPS